MCLSGTCGKVRQNEEWEFACFTCGQVLALPLVGGSASFLTSYMQEINERGCWREGSHLYIPCEDCDMRHCRIDLAKARQRYLSQSGDFNSIRLKRVGKNAYKSTCLEFLPIDLSFDDAAFDGIYNFYTEYQQARDPAHIDTRERFWHVKCKSVIGSVSKENLCRLNCLDANGMLDGSTIVGSCFVRLIVADKLEAVMLLDFLGEHGIAAKVFWYRPENSAYKSPTTALVYKELEIGWRTQAPHSYCSVYDPKNPRLRYKTDYLPITEVLRQGDGWYPAEDEISPSGNWKTQASFTVRLCGA